MVGGTSVTMTPQPSHSHGSNSATEINEVTSLSSLLTTEAVTTAVTGGSTSGATVTISGNHFSPLTEVVYSKREGVIGDSNLNSNKSSNINNKSNTNTNHHSSGNITNDDKLTINAPLLPKNDEILEHNNIGNK